MTEVVIVDSGGANLASIRFAFERLGVRAHATVDGATIASAERVVLPGVGAAAHAMERLRDAGLTAVLRTLTQPVLGICLGMQLLFQRSEECDGHSRQRDQRSEKGDPSPGRVEVAEVVHWFDRSSQENKKYPSQVARSAASRQALPQAAQGDAPSGTQCLGLLPATVRRLIPARDRPIPHMSWNTLQKLSPDPLLEDVNDSDYAYFAHSYAAPVTEHTLAVTDYGGAITAVVRRANVWGTQFHPERSSTTGERILQNFLRL
jgi:glutamine amidotransferase